MTKPISSGDNKRHHLSMIQDVITRLADNSFRIKGWTVALFSAIAILAVRFNIPLVAWILLVPAGAFWLLDAYFLAEERAFRQHYDAIRTTDESAIDFNMRRPEAELWSAFWSGTLLWFYVMLLTMSIAAISIIVSASE